MYIAFYVNKQIKMIQNNTNKNNEKKIHKGAKNDSYSPLMFYIYCILLYSLYYSLFILEETQTNKYIL